MEGLECLVGKTIGTVTKKDWDFHGDDDHVGEYYEVTCTDGTVFNFLCDGNTERCYGTIATVTMKDGKPEGDDEGKWCEPEED